MLAYQVHDDCAAALRYAARLSINLARGREKGDSSIIARVQPRGGHCYYRNSLPVSDYAPAGGRE